MKKPRKYDSSDTSALSIPWVYILLSLADRPRHGYAVMREVESRTDGRVVLWPATLYGAIKRMRRAGLIEEVEAPDDVEAEDRRRKYYRVTALGREVLAEETRRLSDIVDLARAKRILQ